ncbi:MAG: hypothetical protein AB1896_10940 [Thermodesulfobacteriota bacterium]
MTSVGLTMALGFLLYLISNFYENKEAAEEGYDIRFGIIAGDQSGLYDVVTETNSIPLLTQETGFCFGYSIDPPDDRTYLTREVIHLPAPPRHIDFQMPIETLEGGRVIRTPNIYRREQMIYPFCFSEGDPLGPWKLEIYINDELARAVRFQVVRPGRADMKFARVRD